MPLVLALVQFELPSELLVFFLQISHSVLGMILLDSHSFQLFKQWSLSVKHELSWVWQSAIYRFELVVMISRLLRGELCHIEISLALSLVWLDRMGTALCLNLSLGSFILFFEESIYRRLLIQIAFLSFSREHVFDTALWVSVCLVQTLISS